MCQVSAQRLPAREIRLPRSHLGTGSGTIPSRGDDGCEWQFAAPGNFGGQSSRVGKEAIKPKNFEAPLCRSPGRTLCRVRPHDSTKCAMNECRRRRGGEDLLDQIEGEIAKWKVAHPKSRLCRMY